MEYGTIDNPVIIKAENEGEGIEKEHAYLSEKYGMRGVDYFPVKQRTLPGKDYQCDMMTIQLSGGSEVDVYFNIESFYGRM